MRNSRIASLCATFRDRYCWNMGVSGASRMDGQSIAPWYKARVESQNLAPEITDQDRLLLVFAYLGPLSLFSLLASRREFVKWHAKQGMLLSIVIAALLVLAKLAHLLLRRVL